MKKWKAIVGVILIFFLGMFAGGLVVGRIVAKRAARAAQGGTIFTAEEIAHHLGRRLDLDAQQREQVLHIVADTQSEISAVRREAEPKVRATIRDAVYKVRGVLRPEQREKFDRLVAARLARWTP